MKKISVKKIFAIIGIVLGSATAFVGAVVGVMAAMGKFKTPVVYPTVLEFAKTQETIIERKTFNTELKDGFGKIIWEGQDATKYSFMLSGSNPDEEHEVNQKDCYLWFKDSESAQLITLCDKNGKPLEKDANNRYLVQCNEPIYYMVNKLEDYSLGATDGIVELMARSINETLKTPDSPMTIWIDRSVQGVYVKDTTWTDDFFKSTYTTYYSLTSVKYIGGDAEWATIDKKNIYTLESDNYVKVSEDATFDDTKEYYFIEAKPSISEDNKDNIYVLENDKYIKMVTAETDDAKRQSIAIGPGVGFNFEYSVNTELSLRPINSEGVSAKSIELYYDVTGKNGYNTDDYVSVKEEFANPDSPIHSILTYDEEKGVFKFLQNNANAGKHTFIVAIFKTYKGQSDYLASIKGATINNPNHHKLTAVDSNGDLFMSKTVIDITVSDEEISKVEFGENADVVLNLYSNEDYIYANDNKQLKNNLGLTITKVDEYESERVDNNFDFVKFSNLSSSEFTARSAVFTNSSGIRWNVPISVDNYGTHVKQTNIKLTENLVLIDYLSEDITDADKPKYFCSNGIAVLNLDDFSIKLLNPGIYLSFYTKNDNTYLISDFEYEIISGGSGADVKWQIKTKSMPENVENLKLGVLAVNLTGTNKEIEGNYFNSIKASVDTEDLNFTTSQTNIDLNIGFSLTDYVLSEISFEDIISLNSGTYDACVFMVEEATPDNYIVDVIPEVTYVAEDGTVYVLVGSYDIVNGVKIFNNRVKIKENVSGENNTCKIYMLQLKNKFNEAENRKETTQEVIDRILNTEPISLTQEQVVKLHNETEITINSKYVVNTNLLTFKHYSTFDVDNIVAGSHVELGKLGNVYQIYENINGTTVLISSLNVDMIEKITSFYGESAFTFSSDGNVSLNGDFVVSDNFDYLYFKYDVANYDNDDEKEISITFGDGTTYSVGKIKILNGDPENIVFNYNDGDATTETDQIMLSDTISFALSGLNYFKVNVSYTTEYNYEFVLHDANETAEGADDVETIIDIATNFNANISNSNNLGFQDAYDKGQSKSITYSVKVLNGDMLVYTHVGYSDLASIVTKGTNFVLEVKIGNTVKYVKLLIDVSGFELTSTNPPVNIESGIYEIGSVVALKYAEIEILLSEANYVALEPLEINYGDGILTELNGVYKDSEDQEVLKIYDGGSGWTIERYNLNVKLDLELKINTIAGSETISLSFGSSVTMAVNNVWAVKREFYAGTTVKLGNGGYSVFNIEKDESISDSVIKFYIDSSKVDEEDRLIDLDGTFTFAENLIGKVNIQVKINNIVSATFRFDVKPNVIAEKRRELESGTSYFIADLYNFEEYKTDSVVYGSNDESLFWRFYTDNTYSTPSTNNARTEFIKRVNLQTLTTPTNLVFDNVAGSEPTITGGERLSIGEMENLGVKIQKDITLLYSNGDIEYVVDISTFDITNKVTATIKGVNNGVVEFIDLNTYNVVNNVISLSDSSFKLTSVEIEASEDISASVSEDGQTITFNNGLRKEYEDVIIIFTFEFGTQKLTYRSTVNPNIKFNMVPYRLNAKASIEEAKSSSEYDLITGIYDISALKNDGIVNKLTVVRIEDQKGNDISPEIVSAWATLTGGYEKGNEKTDYFKVTFNGISGSEKNVRIIFEITYPNGNTYEYPVDLTIQNKENIQLFYPEKDKDFNQAEIIFLSGYTSDALFLSGEEESNDNSQYTLRNIKYEPVLVYTDKTTTIDLKNEDTIKKLTRISTTSSRLKIELIGYHFMVGMIDYVESYLNLNNLNVYNQLTLPQAQSNISGLLIFKVITDSGNYVYYNLYICCEGHSSGVNLNNNLKVIAYNDENTTEFDDLEGYQIVELSSNKKYQDLVNLALAGTVGSSTFKKSYNHNTMGIYLYNGVATGSTFANSQYYMDITDEIVEFTDYFNVLTLGLVLNDGLNTYCFGTLTVYVQPTIEFGFNSDPDPDLDLKLDYESPNGYFTADVQAYYNEIPCYLTGTWEAEIVSDGGIGATEQDGAIKISNKVPENTEIEVKYTSGNTVVYVTYTYLKTEIPDVSTPVISIGEFNGTKFVTTINLLDTTVVNGTSNKSKFFGTYASDYTISILDETEFKTLGANSTVGNIKRDANSTLTFTQTHQEQYITMKITYSKFGASGESREFIFRVLPGVHFAQTSSGVGLSSSNRLNTTLNSTNTYKQNIGSKITIKKIKHSTGLYSYQINDSALAIHANVDSKLELTFDENSFVIGSYSSVYISALNGETAINFAHSAVNKPVKMTITVKNNSTSEIYGTIDFYINVVQTYSKLEATYVVSGATHENVASGSSVGLTTLFTGNKFKLYKPDGKTAVATADLNISAMGFKTSGNPNEIEFSTMANGTINSSSQITFASVSTNTECVVLLKNNAGITYEDVDVKYNRYIYQIMSGDDVDGIDFSSRTGIYGTYMGTETTPLEHKYVSFMLKDYDLTKSYEGKFVIGTMKDLINTSVFTVSGVSIPSNTVTLSGPNTIVEGYYKNTTNKAVGDYYNGIQYEIKCNTIKYVIYVTLDLDSRSVELFVTRSANAVIGDVKLTLSLGGVNGNGTIINGLEIFLSSDKIEKNSPEIDTVYSNHTVELVNALSGKFIENGGVDANSSTDGYQTKLTYEFANGTYKLDTDTYNITNKDNNLFTYTPSSKELKLHRVGCDINVDINFTVKNGHYILTTINYQFIIKLNMHIVVNGESLQDNLKNNKPETYFVLTNNKTSNFPLTINFTGYPVPEANKDENNEINYYNVLAFDLYGLHKDGDNSSYVMSRDSVVVEEYYPNVSDCYVVSKTGIEFVKDFTGDITLLLSVPTDNGTYSVVWTIYVQGLIDLTYVSNSADSVKIENNAMPFSSNDIVDIISPNTTESGVAIKSEISNKFDESIDLGTKTVKYEYKINVANTTTASMSNKDLFDYANNVGSGSVSNGNMADITYSITLPNVPRTSVDEQQSYYVTYKIYVEYLGLTDTDKEVEVFYVTYRVINTQDVAVYKHSSNNLSADVTVNSRVDGTFLDLLYFKEVFKTTDATPKTYTFTYSGSTSSTVGKIMLDIDNSTTDYEYKSSNGYVRVFENGSNKVKYNISTKKLYNVTDGSDVEIAGSWEDSVQFYDKDGKYSVLQSNFSNIFEYKSFVDVYLNQANSVWLTKDASTVHKFKLIEKETSGRYGIDLTNGGTYKAGNTLFNNEMRAELALVDINNNTKVVTVSAYSESYTAGFRLKSSTVIKAKTNDGAGYALSSLFLSKNVNFNKVYLKTTDVSIVSNKNYYELSGDKYVIVTSPKATDLSNYYEELYMDMSTSIIGVGTPIDNSWVENATGTPDKTDTTVYATIKIPNGTTNPNTYDVKKVKYSNSGGGTYYSISEEFYYIDLNSNEALIVPDYLSVGIEDEWYKITYNPTGDYVQFDISEGIKVWSMDTAGKMISSYPTVADIEYSVPTGVTSPEEYDTTAKNGIVKMSVAALDNYKLQHPNEKNYPKITATIKIGTITIVSDIQFALYTYSKVAVSHTGGSTTDIVCDLTTLTNKLYIPVSSNYVELDDSYKNKVVSIEEKEYNGYLVLDPYGKAFVDGELTLSGEKINEYFTSNPTVTTLKFICVLTTADGSVEFEITVSKQVATS